ncbi:MAG: glycosyltransferase family 9 protein, partial [Planctomycetes bacterium]|nr:glycosyltransferase family 9 protein [Planctomycetota bacterium]
SFGVHVPVGPLPAARLPLASVEPGPEVALLVGAGKPANRLPAALLAECADALNAAGRPCVVLGGPGDRFRARDVLARCRVSAPRIACGQSIRASAEALQRVAAVVGPDTGPLHLARMLGRPVVAVFHAADPARTGPLGYPGPAARVLQGSTLCAPCCASHCKLPGKPRTCLDRFSGAELARAALELIAERSVQRLEPSPGP